MNSPLNFLDHLVAHVALVRWRTAIAYLGCLVACSSVSDAQTKKTPTPKVPAKATTVTEDFDDILTITKLPKSNTEIALAFNATDRESCEQLPKGEPIEIRSMTGILTMRDRLLKKAMPSSRSSVFSVGLEIDSEDKADLPLLSGGAISQYLNEHCVLIQARLRKDLLDNKMYYYHRPLALTVAYKGTRTSLAFEEVVSASIRNFHGIGCFVDGSSKINAEQLRTMVMVFRNNVMQAGTARATANYEFAIIRGRESKLPDRLDQHVFVTAENRQTLYYVSPYSHPTKQARCSIVGKIAITRFDSSGVYPKESATRSYKIDSRAKIRMADIEQYCTDKELVGGFHANVTKVLDAIIDGKFRISAPTVQSLETLEP